MNWSKWAKHALKAMEGDSEESKVSYLHHWLNIEGMDKIEHWKTQGVLIKHSGWLELSEDDKKKKFPDNLTESYFTMVESVLSLKSNPLLAIEELHHLKQNSMTSSEFHALITKTVKRCKFPNIEAEEKAIRDTLYLGMNSQHVRDKCITLLNNGKDEEFTTEFPVQHLEIEDSNTYHKSVRKLEMSTAVNYMQFGHRRSRGKQQTKH